MTQFNEQNLPEIRAGIIEPVGGHSGMDYYDSGLCRGLSNAGVAVTLYTCDELGLLQSAPCTVRATYRQIYGSDPAWRRAVRYLRASWRSLRDARSNNLSSIHFHFFHVGPLELFNVLLARLMRFPIVVTAHDVESLAEKPAASLFGRLAYRMATRVIVHNKVSEEEVRTRLPVGPKRIVVIPHGNYLDMVEPLPDADLARESLGLPRNSKVLLFFGQIKATKGLSVLLEALPTIRQAIPEVRLVVAGRVWKDDFSVYARLIDELGIAEYCLLDIEHIPNDRVATYFAAADVVALPYLKIYQSGVLLMSMSYGKPVLASDLPAMNENIIDGSTGYLFATGDPAALASKAKVALEHKEASRQIGLNGLEYVSRKHSWNRIGSQTAKIYGSIN